MKDSKLDYFKKKILSHLESLQKLERTELKKSLLEKSMLPVGHVSTYKDGSQWRKVDRNKWKCVRQARTYNTESKGAKIALKSLMRKVENATSTDELLDVVMFNIDRFRDDKGQVLDFVKELKKEVESKREKLNIKAELKKPYSKQNSISTLKKWATKENFNRAKKIEKDDMEEMNFQFGSVIKPIGKIDSKYLKELNAIGSDTRVFCGKGYFINHMVHHHPDVPLDDYLYIPDVLENPDKVRIDDKKNIPTLIFQKDIGKNGTVVVNCNVKNGKIIFYKTGFTGKKESYKNKPLVVDRNPTINPLSVGGNGNVSALPNDNSLSTENENKSSNSKYIDYFVSKGVSQESAKGTVKKLDNLIKTKDLEILDWVENTENINARVMFEDKTGLKLPKTIKGVRELVVKWIGKEKLLENKCIKSFYDSLLELPEEEKNSTLAYGIERTKKLYKKYIFKHVKNKHERGCYLIGADLALEEIKSEAEKRNSTTLKKSFANQVNYYYKKMLIERCL